jgi:hypothetical protein
LGSFWFQLYFYLNEGDFSRADMESKEYSHFVKNAQKWVWKQVEILHTKARRSLRTQRENRAKSLPEREQHCYNSTATPLQVCWCSRRGTAEKEATSEVLP